MESLYETRIQRRRGPLALGQGGLAVGTTYSVIDPPVPSENRRIERGGLYLGGVTLTEPHPVRSVYTSQTVWTLPRGWETPVRVRLRPLGIRRVNVEGPYHEDVTFDSPYSLRPPDGRTPLWCRDLVLGPSVWCRRTIDLEGPRLESSVTRNSHPSPPNTETMVTRNGKNDSKLIKKLIYK